MSTKSMGVFRLFVLVLGCLVHSHSGAEVNDYVCGTLKNSYGPYDYRSDWMDKKVDIETYHLTPEVINLVKGFNAPVGADLDYVLRVFPNHHVALNAMIRLGEKQKTAKPIGARYSVECYLQRALRFRNDDAVVRVLYASHLSKSGKRVEALSQLNEAERLEDDSVNINYNMGLIYFELMEYDKALVYAHRAYRSGFPLPGLQNKLKRSGKWKEPTAQSEEGAK